MYDWQAWHIFLADRSRAERYVREIVVPLVAGLRARCEIVGWFFIRYWEGGPHLRLRLRMPARTSVDAVTATLAARIREYVSAAPPNREQFYANRRFDGREIDTASLPWYEEGRIVRLPYEPEIARYAGPDAMPLSESLFEQSSDVAVAVISRTQENEPARLVMALDLMLAAVSLVRPVPNDIVTFFSRYAEMWRWAVVDRSATESMVTALVVRQKQLVQALLDKWLNARNSSEVDDGQEEVMHWRHAVSCFLEQLDELAGRQLLVSPMSGTSALAAPDVTKRVVLASHLHMLNNRLGIAPVQEYCIARLICSAQG